MADSDSKKSGSPFSRRISREDRFGSKYSVTSTSSTDPNLLSVTSLETYLNSHSKDSGDDTCNTLTINVPVKNVRYCLAQYTYEFDQTFDEKAIEHGPERGKGKIMWENVLQRLCVSREQKQESDKSPPQSSHRKTSSDGEKLN